VDVVVCWEIFVGSGPLHIGHAKYSITSRRLIVIVLA